MLPISYVCSTCGHWISSLNGDPDGCPREDEREHHALIREVDPKPLHFPDLGPAHPFLRYRELLTSYHRARHRGMTDRAFVEAVLTAGTVPSEERVKSWPVLSLQSGFLEDAGIWVLGSGRESGVDRRVQFASTLSERLGTFDSPEKQSRTAQACWSVTAPSSVESEAPVSSVRIRESLRLRAYQLVSWTRSKELPFDRVLLSGRDLPLAEAWGEGLRDAVGLGVLPRPPRLHLVVGAEDEITPGYEKTIEKILASMHQDLARARVLEAARRDPRVRRQLGDSVRRGLRSQTPNNPVRLAVERALSAIGSDPDCRDVSYLVLRSFFETGGFPVTIYDRTVRAAAEVVGEAARAQPTLVDLVAAVLLLRTLGDLDPTERICLILP